MVRRQKRAISVHNLMCCVLKQAIIDIVKRFWCLKNHILMSATQQYDVKQGTLLALW